MKTIINNTDINTARLLALYSNEMEVIKLFPNVNKIVFDASLMSVYANDTLVFQTE